MAAAHVAEHVALSANARACRHLGSICFLAAIFSLTIVGCIKHGQQQTEYARGLTSERMGRASLETGTSELPALDAPQEQLIRQSLDIDVTKTNLTIILENIQTEGSNAPDAPWMYSDTSSPFDEDGDLAAGINAFTMLRWNPLGEGDGSCESGGSGRISRGYLDPFNYHLTMKQEIDFDGTRVELRNLSLDDFTHINTVHENDEWEVLGEAGDKRRYNYGSLLVAKGDKVLLNAVNLQLFQNVSYPSPIGEAPKGSFYVGGYFLGEINEFGSDEEWVNQLDPFGMGYVLGIISAVSFGSPSCITSNTYWVTLRGFPDFKRPTITSPYVPSLYNDGRRSGGKANIYVGSNETDIQTAETLANTSKTVVASAVSVCVMGAAGSAAAAVVAPGAVAGPPGQGMFRLVSNTAFVAKVNEVYGFHSDAMAAFGDGMKPFIGKMEFPFAKSEALVESRFGRWFMKTVDFFGRSKEEIAALVRQEGDEEATISDEIFGGCAFYTSIIVFGFLSLHLTIWLATRKKSLELQVTAHAWMIYIFSIVMSYVFTASVLNSMQYLRSHLFRGTGKIGLYIIAFLQLIFIGIGFTAFFLVIMFLAVKRVRSKEVKWVPRNQIPSPKLRNKAVIRGEYQVGEENMFHSLFECYYASMAGPRLWLAGIELIVVFLDAIFTATIWNAVICFAILVCVYAVLFVLFLTFAPFVDKIEGRLITTLGLIDLVLLIVEFMSALGDYETAEKMEKTAVVLGFVSIGFAVLISVYCDLLPMAIKTFKFLRRQFEQKVLGRRVRDSSEQSESESRWSLISGSQGTNDSFERELIQEDEKQIVSDDGKVRGLLSQIFKDFESSPGKDGTGQDGSAHSFDWRKAGKKINWEPQSTGVTPTGDGRLRIQNSEDSDDAIEWPMAGHIIYSVRDLNRRSDDDEDEEEYESGEEEGLIHVREPAR